MFDIAQFPLPYAHDALAPYISAETMHYHHDKHLATYINNLNKNIAGTNYAEMPLRDIIIQSSVVPSDKAVFNNAAQVFNHDFFFQGMTGRATTTMPTEFADAFGGGDNFRKQFKDAALSVFGSGWAWVVRDGYGLKIITTTNADTPIAHGLVPVLTLDVWEHAYYLDYQNRRGDFIDAWLDNLVNWDFVLENMNMENGN